LSKQDNKAIKPELKQLIVDTGLDMIRKGMTVGTWGNISYRDPETDLVYISPSGMNYTSVRSEHIVVMTTDMEIIDGYTEPSVEKNMHTEVYRCRKDVNAVIHTHPIYSTVFGVIRESLPAVSEDFAQIVGAEVHNCATYELPGSAELGKAAVAALGSNNAVLLPNHGALSVGPTMEITIKVSLVLEKNAQIYIFSKLLGTPHLFAPQDIEAMQEFARNQYGKINRELTE